MDTPLPLTRAAWLAPPPLLLLLPQPAIDSPRTRTGASARNPRTISLLSLNARCPPGVTGELTVGTPLEIVNSCVNLLLKPGVVGERSGPLEVANRRFL